jgi:hypothetical protein
MANDQKKNIEAETGLGNYLLKQVYQQVVAWGGILGGAYVGILAAKPFIKVIDPVNLPIVSKIPGLKNASFDQLKWGGGIGAFIGMMTSGIILGYGHWKKIKQSQLQVDEITKNISDIEVFKKTDPELKAENERLWQELHARDKEPSHSRIPTKTIEKSNVVLHGKTQPLAAEMNTEATR